MFRIETKYFLVNRSNLFMRSYEDRDLSKKDLFICGQIFKKSSKKNDFHKIS